MGYDLTRRFASQMQGAYDRPERHLGHPAAAHSPAHRRRLDPCPLRQPQARVRATARPVR
ncbi:hypothetical protein EMIT047CA2_10048 [Pseudomonas soli]